MCARISSLADMADVARKEKLAAAKKKLKSFQKKSNRASSNSPAPVDRNRVPKRQAIENNPQKVEDKNETNPGRYKHDHAVQNDSFSHLDNRVTSGVSAVSPPQPSSTYSTPVGIALPRNERLTESTERLQQLSRQINGLISQSSAYINGEEESSENTSIADLENRNRELASFLEQHSNVNEQLNQQLQELKNKNSRLQDNLDAERKVFEERLKRELGALKEQLQVHIQTIGILVAEKTELQSSLTQSHKSEEKKFDEIEELSGRLKASRQRVADLERSFTSSSTSSQKYEESSKSLSKEVDRLKLDLYKLNKSNEEFQQQSSELQKKLQKKVAECGKIEDDLITVKGKLEMAEIHIGQLRNGESKPDNSQQVDQLLAEKSELGNKINEYQESFQKLSTERDQLVQQYQEYIDQQNQQAHHLQVQTTTLMEERDKLFQRNKDMEATIENLKNKRDTSLAEASDATKEMTQLIETVAKLREQNEELNSWHQAQVSDNSQLSRLVTEKEEKIGEFELALQRMNENQVDKDKLLDSMQSDKTALSRAIAQNRELKTQLAELQNGFVKMSNDNMELLNDLQSEQHISKELAGRLSQQEEELKEIREQLITKEGYLQQLQEQNPDDRIRHDSTLSADDFEQRVQEFQQQAPLLENLQRELSSAQDTINALTNQNSKLRAQLLQGTAGSLMDSGRSQEQVESLSASIRQLELERNEVLEQLKVEQEQRREVDSHLQDMRDQLASQTPATLNGDIVNKAQFGALQHAMKQLEDKYTKAMRDKADLTDKREQLEHIILQLQGETDTIGEYVSLYQTQRSVLKQRQEEKDHYISRLSRDREELQDKLGQLQALVVQLLGERQMLHDYQVNDNPSKAAANHIPLPGSVKPDPSFGSKLDSSQLEDWPEYTSSSEGSETSEVEQIVGGPEDSSNTTASTSSDQAMHKASPDLSNPKPDIPDQDHTAQKIMNLLTELGTSNVIERSYFTGMDFLYCSHCTGKLWIV